MSKIKLNFDYSPVNGKQLSFVSPCGSGTVESLVINDAEYTLVDADGVDVAGIENLWNKGALVSVILDVNHRKAYVQNANTNSYIEGRLLTARGIESLEHPGCFYYSISLGMAETPEWINPPMVPGVEYRTTERFNGQVVYTMIVESEDIHNSSGAPDYSIFSAPIPFNPDEWCLRLVSVSGTIWGRMDNDKYTFYSAENAPILKDYAIDYNYDYLSITLYTMGNDINTSTKAYFTLKYIKEPI